MLNKPRQHSAAPDDVRQRREFLAALFAHLDQVPGHGPGGFRGAGPFIEVRSICPASGRVTQSFAESLDHALAAIENAAHAGLNVYVGLHPRSTRGGRDADVQVLTTGAVLDLDDLTRSDGRRDEAKHKDALQLLATLPHASIITWSGGGLQAVWLLEQPVEATPENVARRASICTALRERINAAGIGKADPVADLARVVRVPGTLNLPDARKRKRGRVDAPAELLVASPERYSVDDLEGAFGACASEPRAQSSYAPHGDATLPERVRQLLEADRALRARFAQSRTAQPSPVPPGKAKGNGKTGEK